VRRLLRAMHLIGVAAREVVNHGKLGGSDDARGEIRRDGV
jgi:hypothetical protein